MKEHGEAPYFVDEALDILGIDTPELEHLSWREVLKKVLEYNGIIGFTEDIIDTMKWLGWKEPE